jgi:hypothetical protein
MRSEYRTLILTLTLLVAVPLLFGIGDELGGLPFAISLSLGAALAAWAYSKWGDPKPPAAGGPAG